MIAKILKDTFFYSPVFNLEHMAGQYCSGNKYFVGGHAGPSKNISNLLHEIGHFAEREVEKLKLFPSNGWGFYPGKFWQIGTNWGHWQSTDEQVKRESRVWAFQLSAQIHLGLSDSPYELVSSADWLPAWCFFSAKHKHNTAKAKYYLAKTVERSMKNYTWDRLVEDFQYRIAALEKLSDTD